jgi:general secretion pathway protein D
MIDVQNPAAGSNSAGREAWFPSASDLEVEAIARAESGRINQLIANAKTQLATARAQLREGRTEDAIANVDATLATMPVNSMTQNVVADLKREKASALLERAQAALKRGDACHGQSSHGGARATCAGEFPHREHRSPDRAGRNGPVTVALDPNFAADRAATAQLVAKGRAQYVAGDLDGAQETFRMVEAQEPDNTWRKASCFGLPGRKPKPAC